MMASVHRFFSGRGGARRGQAPGRGQAPRCGSGCPSTPGSLSATNQGTNGAAPISFTVADAETRFRESGHVAFDDLAGPGVKGLSFDWGLPIFCGRRILVSIETTTQPPSFAY